MRKLLLTLCLWSTLSAASEFPIVIDPVINAMPPGAKVTAGYFTLVNENSTELVITGAYSPTIAKIEIHQSYIEDDVAKMKMQESVSIPPGETLEFTHGNYHLMLMELTETLNPGQTVDVILSTSIGDMMIEMPVEKISMAHNHDKNSTATENTEAGVQASQEDKMEHNHHGKKMDTDEQVSSN